MSKDSDGVEDGVATRCTRTCSGSWSFFFLKERGPHSQERRIGKRWTT